MTSLSRRKGYDLQAVIRRYLRNNIDSPSHPYLVTYHELIDIADEELLNLYGRRWPVESLVYDIDQAIKEIYKDQRHAAYRSLATREGRNLVPREYNFQIEGNLNYLYQHLARPEEYQVVKRHNY